jgi:hypothetical protein
VAGRRGTWVCFQCLEVVRESHNRFVKVTRMESAAGNRVAELERVELCRPCSERIVENHDLVRRVKEATFAPEPMWTDVPEPEQARARMVDEGGR